MTSPPSWTVVVFQATEDENESVQAVPSSWINGDQCAWPPLTGDRINVALRKRQYSKAWPCHKVRILRNSTYADYNVARLKAQKAELTSDLGTDEEEKKRVRKPRIISSSSESETDEPNIKKKRGKIALPEPPKLSLKLSGRFCNNNEEETSSFSNSLNAEASADASADTDEVLAEPLIDQSFLQSKDKTRDRESQPSCNCKNGEKTLFIIKNLLLELNGKVDRLLGQRAPDGVALRIEEADILGKSEITYPINTIEDINKLNQFLETKEHYVAMVNFLAKQGGTTLSEFIRRCLAPIIHDTIAVQFSFQGRKQKQPFNNLQLCKAVLGKDVREYLFIFLDAAGKSYPQISKKEAEQAIGAWLKRTQERMRRSAEKN